ncbi:SusC/RagA family TonB-linked outer membrane protein [Kordia jejudonensis]|uniref:SusC/RagA family TonB-linked outer membrane protein n=1 Tax=Kordia jejudonensis TaxID=1348245 RepID=UPI0006296C66|nr:TonB-dependent receptor [Kordia jejudonensis]
MRTKFSGILTLFLALFVQILFAQQQTVSGTVTDDTGLPLPGATVSIKGTSKGITTDFDGKFSIKADNGQVLVFSYIGYKAKEMTVSGTTVNVQLESDNTLGEVVVVAYGTEKKSNVASAVSVVQSESIEQVPNASIDQILQGQAAGLNIQTSSGQPGASGTILLRGRNSINGNQEPLFIIDGVPVDEDNFRSLNANDIENVSILKDASASALYGNRGANGVIIVTTKTGKKNGGTKIQYRTLYGLSTNINPNFELMNSRQYLTYQRQRGLNNFSDTQINALSTQTNTNWTDLLLRTGTTLSHEVNVTTGGENARSYSSLGYFEQEGITLRSNLKRFTFRNNTNVSSSNDKFNLSTNLTIGYSVNDTAANPGSGSLNNPFINAYIGNPALNPFNPDGSLDLTGDGTTGFQNSPIVALNQATLNTFVEDELKIVGRIASSLEVAKNLTVGNSIGMDYQQFNQLIITDPNSLRGLNNDTNNPPAALIKGSQAEAFSRDVLFNVNTYLTYKNTFNDVHNVEASAFVEYVKGHSDTYGFEAFGLNSKLPGSGAGFTSGNTTEGPNNDLYNYIPTAFSTTEDRGLFSYFAVAKYNYDDKFGVQANIRRDASSQFSKTNRWGTFWAAAAFWNLHREKFMEDVEFINNLKIRASYGKSGNDRIGNAFSAFDLIGTTNNPGNYNGSGQGYQGTNGFWTTQLGNPDLKWETTVKANIGIDFAMFENRLSGNLDFYQTTTEDLFLNRPISTISAFNNISANVGEIQNKGIELALSYDIIRSNDRKGLNWSVNGNIAYNKNEITKLVGDGLIETTRTALAEGNPFGTFYAVRWAGVNPANGSPLYFDADGNITDQYNADDRVLLDENQDPKFVGGFGTNISYKGFALNALFTYAMDQYRYNGSLAVVEDPTLVGISNQSTSILREWQQAGDITDIPSSAFGSTRLLLTDRYIEDASFLRLRNVTLSYTLDKDMLGNTKLFSSIRMYVQGQNLLTWTKWRGFDPESNVNSTFFEFPTPKTWTLGLDVNF